MINHQVSLNDNRCDFASTLEVHFWKHKRVRKYSKCIYRHKQTTYIRPETKPTVAVRLEPTRIHNIWYQTEKCYPSNTIYLPHHNLHKL